MPLDVQALDVTAGLRAATACALPLLASEAFSEPAWNWIAVVAFWTCLVDTGGPWLTRLAAQAGFALLAAVGTSLALLATTHLWLAVPFAFAWCLGASLLRVYGNAAATVGIVLSIAVLVGLGLPAGDAAAAAARATLTIAGGLWAMVLTLVVWRLHPHGPARRAVALCWLALADFARALGRLQKDGAADADAWSRLARERRRRAREAIEAAGRLLVAYRRARGGITLRGQHLLMLLADADRVFAALVALSELLELAGGQASRPSQARIRRAIGLALGRLAGEAEALAATLVGRAAPRWRPAATALATVRRRLGAGLQGHSYEHAVKLLERIARQLDDAIVAAGDARARRTLAEAIAERPAAADVSAAALLGALRDNLTFSSVAFRHALRVAVTAAAAVLVTGALDLERGYWLSITAIAILQPYVAMTWQRSLERVAGTILGGLVAAGIGLFVQRPLTLAIVIFPLAALAMAVRSVNYAVFVFCLTPPFVLMAEAVQGGGSGWHLAELRALDSVLGGLVGLAAAFLLWPSREAPHLPARLAEAVRATRDYLVAALAASPGEPRPDLDAARRRAGLAVNNAEAALQRLVREPKRQEARVAEPTMTILAALRRLLGVAAALPLLAGRDDDALRVPALAAMSAWLSPHLTEVAEALSGSRAPAPPPELPPGALPDAPTAQDPPAGRLLHDVLVRARRQVELVEAAAARLAAQ